MFSGLPQQPSWHLFLLFWFRFCYETRKQNSSETVGRQLPSRWRLRREMSGAPFFMMAKVFALSPCSDGQVSQIFMIREWGKGWSGGLLTNPVEVEVAPDQWGCAARVSFFHPVVAHPVSCAGFEHLFQSHILPWIWSLIKFLMLRLSTLTTFFEIQFAMHIVHDSSCLL